MGQLNNNLLNGQFSFQEGGPESGEQHYSSLTYEEAQVLNQVSACAL